MSSFGSRLAGITTATLVLPLAALSTSPAAEPPAQVKAHALVGFEELVQLALDHYRGRRHGEARDAFARALAEAPASADKASLEFNVAACDYELGRYRDAEARFARLATGDPARRADALLHAGWSALGAGDEDAAASHLDAVDPGEGSLAAQRQALARAIDERRREAESLEFESDVNRGTLAYNAGDSTAAQAAVRAAREREAAGSNEARATLDYLEGLIAHDQGNDVAARQHFESSLRHDPGDGAVHAALGELAHARGDGELAEQHYRASLDAPMTEADVDTVSRLLGSLYSLPPAGLSVWGALGAGYDSNATQSGSSDAVGFAGQGRQGSAYTAPAWGLEYRWNTGSEARVGPYYVGDWLMLAAAPVQEASLQSHEAGLRFYLAPTRALSVRAAAAGGVTFSGLDELAPFSLDALIGARVELEHGPRFRSSLLAEIRPALGLSERQYLTGARSDVIVAERFESGSLAVGLELGLRYNAIGTQSSLIDPAQFPRCNLACVGARYHIPLGYFGPLLGAQAELAATRSLSIGSYARYEHRSYLGESVIEGPALPELLSALSRKTRQDDRYLIGGRARYRIGAEPALGLWLDYSARISRSNVAFRRGDLEHAFDYDDRNFTQHLIELGVELQN